MEDEAEHFVARCECQRYANNMHRPAKFLHSVISPWTFMKLGMDIIGPMPQAKGKIKWITSVPYHLMANRQAESTNKVIINNLKKQLEESKVKWQKVLPGVLWAYRTMTKTSTGETPFLLVYGTEALIPADIGKPSTRYTRTIKVTNEKELRINLDLTEERREALLVRMADEK
ncbi:uncharacterized protein [Nicotiana tomentosiformis]|uniref:uncharacterized protein n=1 Tax=Nicotiana tomentosiformis TaxID=4098 RepID=UPI00051BDC35|nr:uncharacterized protein LOC117278406 [Nicotiana tomentosiformis]